MNSLYFVRVSTLKIGASLGLLALFALVTTNATIAPQPKIRSTAGINDLGKRRSRFGDKWTRSTSRWQSERDWMYHDMLGDYSTEIYFPVGSANERYYVQKVNVKEHHTQKTKEEFVLLFETKGRDGTIHLEWKVFLDCSATAPVVIPGLLDKVGTLTAMLSRRGMDVREPIGRNVKKKLDEVRGLAGYWRVLPVNDSLLYWYVNKDGAATTPKRFSADSDSFAGFPATPFPYPVTKAEVSEIQRKSVQKP